MDRVKTFTSFDGIDIAYEDLGSGRPVLMLHGFLFSARINYVDPGIAETVRARGLRTIIPDLRGHGRSGKPEDPSDYPKDVLAMDQEALLAHLGVTDYMLVGYSLGARTAARMLLRGARPVRCVLAGMGDSGLLEAQARSAGFQDLIRNGARSRNPATAQLVADIIQRENLKTRALINILDQQVSMTPEQLASIATRILVVSGRDDEDNGSAERLAQLLPNAEAQRVPGTHVSAISAPELGRAIADFLSG